MSQTLFKRLQNTKIRRRRKKESGKKLTSETWMSQIETQQTASQTSSFPIWIAVIAGLVVVGIVGFVFFKLNSLGDTNPPNDPGSSNTPPHEVIVSQMPLEYPYPSPPAQTPIVETTTVTGPPTQTAPQVIQTPPILPAPPAAPGPSLPVPVITKYQDATPQSTADLETVQAWLLTKGYDPLNPGQQLSDDQLTALSTTSHWEVASFTPKVYFYPAGFNTRSSFTLYFDDSYGTWALTDY